MDTTLAGQVHGTRARSRGFVDNYDALDREKERSSVKWDVVAVYGGYFAAVFGFIGWGIAKWVG